MSTTTISPNMNLILPTPGVEPGPQYATDQNQDLIIIDGHNHGPGSGVPVTPTGLNINTNLSFLNHSATNVYSVIFSAPASNAILTNLYTNSQSGGGITDLFYNDGAGNVIALTKAGAVNATIASIPGESYSGGTFTWVQGNGSTTPANFDIGSITIRPNTAGTTNGVILGPPSGISSLYNVQLPAVPASATSFMVLDSSGNMSATIAVSGGLTSSNIATGGIATSNIANGAVTQVKLAPRTLGTSVGAGGVGLSASCGAFSLTSIIAPGPVTNLSVTLVTTGRPVFVSLVYDDNGTNTASLSIESTIGTEGLGVLFLLNGSTVIDQEQLTVIASPGGGTVAMSIPLGSLQTVDTSVNGTPGTYTYTVNAQLVTGSALSVSYAKLIAYEI